MASKGQKFKKYKPELKVQILKEYKSGETSIPLLAKKYKISIGTVATWVYKNNRSVDITKDNRGKNKKKIFTKSDLKEQLEILKKFQAFLEAQNDKK